MTEEEKKQQLSETIAAGVREVFESGRFQDYLKAMSQIHEYSFRNAMLIIQQKKDATQVAGYSTWKKLGRYVKQGEKGIAIFQPCLKKERFEKPAVDETRKPVLLPDGTPKIKKETVERVRFKVGYIFDLSQTDGEPLPEICKELTGAREDYASIFGAVKRLTDYEIRFAELPGGTKGYCDFAKHEIVLRFGMSDEQTVKTLLHEFAHSRLHEADEGRTDTQKTEVEAESVAYILADSLGMDTSSYSFDYLASWSQNLELDKLREILETIRAQAAALCGELEQSLAEVTKESVKEVPVSVHATLEARLETAKQQAAHGRGEKEGPTHAHNPIY